MSIDKIVFYEDYVSFYYSLFWGKETNKRKDSIKLPYESLFFLPPSLDNKAIITLSENPIYEHYGKVLPVACKFSRNSHGENWCTRRWRQEVPLGSIGPPADNEEGDVCLYTLQPRLVFDCEYSPCVFYNVGIMHFEYLIGPFLNKTFAGGPRDPSKYNYEYKCKWGEMYEKGKFCEYSEDD